MKKQQTQSNAEYFRRLVNFRSMAIVLNISVLVLIYTFVELSLALGPISIIITCHALLNLAASYALKSPEKINDSKLFSMLIGDTVIFAGLLYFTGGSTNPLVSLLLLPLITVASILPQRYVLMMGLLTTALYTALMFQYEPLKLAYDKQTSVHLHIIGMWFGFLLAALMVVFFIARMAASLRKHTNDLAKIREQSLRDEHMVAIGTLATAAAHELGTPLTTMSVIAHDLSIDYHNNAELKEKTAIFNQELRRCKSILSNLAANNDQYRAEEGNGQQLDHYLKIMLEAWRSTRHETELQVHIDITSKKHPPPKLFVDKRLTQCLYNLLDNAADAAKEIAFSALWDDKNLKIIIQDHGQGIPEVVIQSAGMPFFTTKPHGQGLGLFLAYSVIDHYGGKISLRNNKIGGCVTLHFPLSTLTYHAG